VAATDQTESPDPAEVRRIAAIRDPILRNLQITHCYWRLAEAMAQRTGTGANWCTFATWASKQAGSTIRGEDAEALLRERLGRRRELLHPLQSLWRWLLRRGLLDPSSRLGRVAAEIHTPFDGLERASDAVSRGNKKVFEEIGLEFARYLHECAPDAPEIQSFLDSLTPGEPPDGKRYLRQAFQHYQRQSAEPGANARAQLLLTANLEIGLHEQTRLQPEIREAMDAALSPKRRILTWPLQRKLTQLSRQVITESLMVLTLPGVVLWLGRHLEASGEVVDPELRELMERYEPVPPAADDCGAHDWSVLDQRMHYLVHLFRAYHAEEALASPPFTPAQVERILAGDVPDGEL
jgi:hypothetical protein